MEFRILGPVEVWRESTRVHLTGRKSRSLLAALLLTPGRAVTEDRLIRLTWGEDAPVTAPRLLQQQISALRGLLGDAEIIARDAAGYTFRGAPDSVDLHVFDRHCADARSALGIGDADKAAELLGAALALWRGPALSGAGDELVAAAGPGLDERRLAALRDRVEADLARGRHDELIAELPALVGDHPYDERLRRHLMTALDRAGRRGEAIAAYHEVRELLSAELGVDPGAELQAAYRELIDQPHAAPRASVPRQLPPASIPFVGRDEALAGLDAILSDGTGLATIVGTGGVGKTTLAVHWGRSRASAFPDGQLYLDLRGFGEAEPMTPATALELLLLSLGTPARDIPQDADARAAAYRSLIAGRRMLVLLDNTRDTEQVRPLLPGDPATLVLVTSRDMLSGLSAREGAARLPVDRLDHDDAAELLRRILGHRATDEPDALELVIRRCDSLPLALRVAAERTARRPDLSLARVAAELDDEIRRFRFLDAGDSLTRVGGVFSWSLRHLPEDTVRTFRLLGLHPTADATPHLAANLADVTPDAAAGHLRLLADGCLLQVSGPGRYRVHDLLRAFAAATTRETETPEARAAALSRLHAWYTHTSTAAMDAIGARPDVPTPPEPPRHPGPAFADERAATGWLAAELPAAIEAVRLAAAGGDDREVRDLHVPLAAYSLMQRRTDDAVAVLELGIAASARLGDVPAQAAAAINLANTYSTSHRFTQAGYWFERAAALHRDVGDIRGEAAVMRGIAIVHGRAGRFDEAIATLHRAADLAREAGDEIERARCQVNIATAHSRLDRWEQAIPLYQEASAIFADAGDRQSVLAAKVGLAYCRCELGQLDEAAEDARWVVDSAESLGNLAMLEHGLLNLGMIRSRQARHDEAIALLQQAVTIVDDWGDPQRRCTVYNALGTALADAGRTAEARRSYETAMAMAREIDDEREMERSREGLADLPK
ncbi:XRE family transcriptional regulator [Actinorhabdospora filicis]|uniref:XRE family transcriptional regulator n=1 Tax=Actinorhabdospora filicis TaxID=1785913 RepID=A0A9W6W6G8_9ACTN|nr:BTAD domain-containing putative transcriptional regulator [Actinorhabdospora filicis]GLZ81532.1 XRE family transcriptional regulator [Actinorhabdospora filicis]